MSNAKASTVSNVSALAESLVSLGSEVRQVRKARGLSLKVLAQDAGISVSHLSAIERGTANPSFEMVYKIAEALGISPDCSSRGVPAAVLRNAPMSPKAEPQNPNTLMARMSPLWPVGHCPAHRRQLLHGIAVYEPHSSRP